MKYSILIPVALFCGFSATAHAQQASAPVLADINQALVVTSTGQTHFGSVDNYPHTEMIDPVAPTGNQTTAQFEVTFTGNISTGCSSEVILIEAVSSASMTFTPQLSFYGDGGNNQSASIPSPCSLTLSGSGTVSWWLGGSLEVAANQATGSYSGVFTFTAAYQ